MTLPPASLRRLAVALGVLFVFFAPSVATLWIWSPDPADIQARVTRLANSNGLILLREDDVPALLADAVVAIEDERFYSHHGVDSIGLGRALLYDLVNICLCQGGSTITQQLVKDVYLGGSDLGYNKLEGLALALKVERLLNKRQIMADYLSIITTGFGRRGVTAAACAYYGGAAAGTVDRPVRAARRRDPGTVAVRPDDRPGGGTTEACAGAGGHGRKPLHHAGAGASRQRRAGARPRSESTRLLVQPGERRGRVETVVGRHLDGLDRGHGRRW